MNSIDILKIYDLKPIERKSIPLIHMSVEIADNILNIHKPVIVFRRFVKKDKSILIQDTNGYVYHLKFDDIIHQLENYIKVSGFVGIQEIDYKRVPSEQTGVSEVIESHILREDYESSDQSRIPEMVSVNSSVNFSQLNILLKRNVELEKQDGFTSLESLLKNEEIDDRLNVYSPYNYVDFKNNSLMIEKSYTYCHAQEIQDLFVTEPNKTILFLNSSCLSVVKDEHLDFTFTKEMFIKIGTFFQGADDHCSIEIEKVNGVFEITAIYQRYSFYSWARIPKEHFELFQLDL